MSALNTFREGLEEVCLEGVETPTQSSQPTQPTLSFLPHQTTVPRPLEKKQPLLHIPLGDVVAEILIHLAKPEKEMTN